MGQITRLAPGRRFCQAVIHGDTVYVAGRVAPKTVPSVKGQTQQILKEIDKALKAAGTNKSKLLMVNIWLSDIRTFDEMNEASGRLGRQATICPHAPPSRPARQPAISRRGSPPSPLVDGRPRGRPPAGPAFRIQFAPPGSARARAGGTCAVATGASAINH